MSRRQRCSSAAEETALLDERVLVLVFKWMNWDPRELGRAACVSRKLRAVARRVLWRELCLSRAPRMASSLGRVAGGWQALAKLLFFCCGWAAGAAAGHFVGSSRFSKTSGRSFLARRCWGDVLYVSDPCEHARSRAMARARAAAEEEVVGVYRGVFVGFMRSRTRAWLIRRQVELEGGGERCPYCGARVWSMTAARMVPRSAARRLGAHDGRLDYFVCLNGHLYGHCWLVPLSSDDDDDDDDGRDDVDGDGSEA